MTRLIVEEGGKRRAFKVGDGVITVGSGPQAALKLTSAGVAELHAELVVHEGTLKLRPRPGVLPPKIGGKPVGVETLVPAGASVQIGEARISVEAPEAGAGAARTAPGARKPKEKEDWERSSRHLYKDSSIKPKHMLLLAIPVAVLAFFIFKKAWTQAPGVAPLTLAVQINRARENIKSGVPRQAAQDLDQIPASVELTAEQRATIADLRAQIAAASKLGDLALVNIVGDKYLDSQLKNYEQQRLQGKVDKPAVRVFLKRVAEFERRWPEHPEMEWVRRMKERYSLMVDLKQPPNYADVAFEVQALTWDNPRRYDEALKTIQRFLDASSGDERAQGLTLLDETIKARELWFTDKMLEARHQYDKGQLTQSAEWLAKIIVFSGDEQMADAAANEFVKFDQLDEYLRGYRNNKPDYWEGMAKNKVLAQWMREHPLDAPVK